MELWTCINIRKKDSGLSGTRRGIPFGGFMPGSESQGRSERSKMERESGKRWNEDVDRHKEDVHTFFRTECSILYCIDPSRRSVVSMYVESTMFESVNRIANIGTIGRGSSI
jgi:hypothetical protein